MNQSKELWLDIITKIQSVYETKNVVVAGGACRDYLMKMDCKDIDVFTDIESELDLSFGIPALESLGFTDVRIFDIPEEAADDVDQYNIKNQAHAFMQKEMPDDQHEFSAIYGILEAEYKGVPIQIMANLHKDWSGDSVVARFDYSRVQCWSDGISIHETTQGKTDRLKNTYTFVRDTKGTKRRVDRWFSRLEFVGKKPLECPHRPKMETMKKNTNQTVAIKQTRLRDNQWGFKPNNENWNQFQREALDDLGDLDF